MQQFQSVARVIAALAGDNRRGLTYPYAWDLSVSNGYKMAWGADAETGQVRIESWNSIRFLNPVPGTFHRIVGIGTWYD